MTSLVDRLESELHAAATARPRDSARYAAVLERAVQAWSADPQVAEVLDLADLYFELATEYESLRLYCRAMQQQLVELSQTGIPGLAIAPLRVAPFTACCAEQGKQADSEARATYAAHLAAHAESGVLSWPPGRNQPCWCGSGRKYKKRCAATLFVDTEARQ